MKLSIRERRDPSSAPAASINAVLNGASNPGPITHPAPFSKRFSDVSSVGSVGRYRAVDIISFEVTLNVSAKKVSTHVTLTAGCTANRTGSGTVSSSRTPPPVCVRSTTKPTLSTPSAQPARQSAFPQAQELKRAPPLSSRRCLRGFRGFEHVGRMNQRRDQERTGRIRRVELQHDLPDSRWSTRHRAVKDRRRALAAPPVHKALLRNTTRIRGAVLHRG